MVQKNAKTVENKSSNVLVVTDTDYTKFIYLIIGLFAGWIIQREIMSVHISDVMREWENKLVCNQEMKKCWVVREFIHGSLRK